MKKRIALTIVLILLALLLAGCRVRTTVQAPLPGEETGTDETPVSNAPEQPGKETEPDEPAVTPEKIEIAPEKPAKPVVETAAAALNPADGRMSFSMRKHWRKLLIRLTDRISWH